jgi:hypothetical protein
MVQWAENHTCHKTHEDPIEKKPKGGVARSPGPPKFNSDACLPKVLIQIKISISLPPESDKSRFSELDPRSDFRIKLWGLDMPGTNS